MKTIELESWALRVLERVEKHLPVEDSQVELKGSWPEPVKAARRLAGHANAARGESILWLIGADEKQATITGASLQDLATWFPQVKACFESEVPLLQDLNITHRGKTVAALCFDTGRFPYLVKNPKGGEIQFEVPWREGTAIRSATRNDLILMLSLLIHAPNLELLDGQMTLETAKNPDGLPNFHFELSVYLIPSNTEEIVLPRHKCTAQLLSASAVVTESFTIKMETPASRYEQQRRMRERGDAIRARLGVGAPAPASFSVKAVADTIEITEDELLARGPGKIFLSGCGFAASTVAKTS